jgi:hypothetical protein
MKKVLLAIDGLTPDQKAFQYAVGLCQRIRVELNIFQVIQPAIFKKYRESLCQKGRMVRRLFEETMVAATYAEADEHATARDMLARASRESRRLLQASEKAGVHCHFIVRSGNPDREIVDYVKSHRDVVMTIYDATGAGGCEAVGQSGHKSTLALIKKDLDVPVITVEQERRIVKR